MSEAWGVVRAALRDTWRDLFTTMVVSLIWLGLTLAVVTAPPAAVALFYTGHRLAHDEPTGVRDFWHAFRRFWGLGWRWGLLQIGVLVVLVGDVILTGRLTSGSANGQLIQGFYLALLAAWLLLQVYTLAFLFELEQPSVRTALRNGAVMMGKNPVFSLALGLMLLALLVAGTLLFFLASALGGVLVATAGSHAVQNRLQAHAASSPGVE
jgi:hypothetical protein